MDSVYYLDLNYINGWEKGENMIKIMQTHTSNTTDANIIPVVIARLGEADATTDLNFKQSVVVL